MHFDEKGIRCIAESRKGFDYIEFKQFLNGKQVETQQEEWNGKWEKGKP